MWYNSEVTDQSGHSRRDFLKGRGAAHVLAEKLAQLADRHLGDGSPKNPNPTEVTRQHLHVQATRRAMACEFQVTYHKEDLDAAGPALDALDSIEALEAQLTIYRQHSEILEINRQAASKPVLVEPHLFALLEQAKRIYEQTGGAFDITSTPLSRVWGFLKREGRRPGDEEIATALARVGCDKVLLDQSDGSVRFSEPDVEINLNSIGKGYALDRVSAGMEELGVKDFLWHGGSSSVLARGCNRSTPQQGWTIGLRDPLSPERRIAELFLRDRALATAGGGTQFFEHEGSKFSHIIDPRTGWPARNRYTATVLAPTAAEADAVATALFVMDLDEAGEYCASHPAVAAVLVFPGTDGSGIAIKAWGLEDDDWQVLDDSLLA